MENDKPKRKYVRKAKPMTTEETVQPTPEVIAPVTPEVIVPLDAIVEFPPLEPAPVQLSEPISPENDGPENFETVPENMPSNLDGLKSCSRCGADESPTVTLTVVGDEKLCANHL